MTLNENWLENFNKLKKKQKQVDNCFMGVVIGLLLTLLSTFYYTEYSISNYPMLYLGLYLVGVIFSFYNSKLRYCIKRGEIYIDILEKNEGFNLENIKHRLPKKLLRVSSMEAFRKQTNKELILLRNHGVVNFNDGNLF